MEDRDVSAFGSLLRRHRQAARLTQEELAERARLSPRAVIDLERGARSVPHRETVRLLADALALTPRDRAAFEEARRGVPLAHAGAEAPTPDSPLESPQSQPPRRRGFLGSLPSGSLVGREPELRRALDALTDAAGGRTRVLLVSGDPGVGKTRLAQELLMRADADGFRVLVGRCQEQHASHPFSPFVEALTGALALSPPTLRGQLLARFPHLAWLLPALQPEGPRHDQEVARMHILWAVDGFLDALAAEAPLALLLDDLHWADSASLDLLLHLARRLRGERVLLLATYRDVALSRGHPLERALADLARERLADEITLRDLTPDATAALIVARFGPLDGVEDLAALVHARTAGNPFFTEEVLSTLVEQGVIGTAGAGWDRAVVQRIQVPRSVRSVVGERVGRLPAGMQEVLRVASILGQEWDLDLLVGATGEAEEAVLDALDAALAARLLEERPAGREERYAFVHALIGQALSEDVPRHRLRRLHLRTGEALERLGGERPEAWAELARHFLVGGDAARALRYAARAGDHAASRFANAEAAQHYQAALELLRETGDDAGAAGVGEKLGVTLFTMALYDQALAVLEQAAAAHRAMDDLAGWARVVAQIGQVHADHLSPEEGIRRIRAAIDLLAAREPAPGLAALYAVLADIYDTSSSFGEFAGSRYGDALAAAERAAALARAEGDTRVLAKAEYLRASALLFLGRPAEALPVRRAAIALAEEAGDLYGQGYAILQMAGYMIAIGDFGEAARLADQLRAVARRRGDPLQVCATFYLDFLLAFHRGEWGRARASLEQGALVVRQVGAAGYYAACLLLLHFLCLVEGLWEEAARHQVEIAAVLADTNLVAQTDGLECARARFDLLQGRPGAALARLEPLASPNLWLAPRDVPLRAWATLDLGDTGSATALATAVVDRARAEGHTIALIEGLLVRAAAAIRREDWAEADHALQETLALARPMPYPYAEARALHLAGTLHAGRGARAAAREQLAAALAIFQRLGARPAAERTEHLLAALG